MGDSMKRLLCGLLVLAGCAHAPATRSGFADVRGGRIHYEVTGAGQPVVLIHGGFMDLAMWEPQVEEFARNYQVIRYDNRGHGRSPTSSEQYDPAADLAALLDTLRVEQAHIVGLSMGGSIAIDFAIQYPDRVKSLVVAEPGLGGHRWSDDVIGTMRAIRDAQQSGGRAHAIETFLSRPVFASAKDKPAAFAIIRRQLEANFSLDPKPIRAMTPPAKERLGEIGVPTLVIVSTGGGPDSRVIRDAILERVPNAHAAVIEESGHMMNLEQPQVFNRLVLEFVAANR